MAQLVDNFPNERQWQVHPIVNTMAADIMATRETSDWQNVSLHGSSIIQSRSWHEDSGSNEPEQ